MDRNSEREQYNDDGEYEDGRPRTSTGYRVPYSDNEEPARVHLYHKQRHQTGSSLETVTNLSYLPSIRVGQAAVHYDNEKSRGVRQEKCKQVQPDTQERRPSSARRRSSVNFKGQRKNFIPVWYQQAGQTSSSWFDGADYYNKVNDPARQPGAFAPDVHVEHIVKQEKKKRGIKDTEPYSDEDHHTSRKKKSGRRQSATSTDSEFQSGQQSPRQSTDRGKQHAYRTDIFYDCHPFSGKPYQENQPHQLTPIHYAVGRTPLVYNVNTNNQIDPTVRTNTHDETEELALIHGQNISVANRSAHFTPSNDHSSRTSRSRSKTSRHHSTKRHSPNSGMSSHRHTLKDRSLYGEVSSHRHTSKHPSPNSKKSFNYHPERHRSQGSKQSSQHSTRNHSPNNENSSHQHFFEYIFPLRDKSTQRSHSRHRSARSDRSRHHQSKSRLAEKRRSKESSISRHRSTKQVGSGHNIPNTISVTSTVSSHISLSVHSPPKTGQSPHKSSIHKPTDTVVPLHGKSSHRSHSRHHSSKHHRSLNIDSKHHGQEKSRASDRSISRHQSPKQLGPGGTVSSRISLLKSQSPRPLEQPQQTPSRDQSPEEAKIPHKGCSRHFYYKVISTSSRRHSSKNLARKKTSKHRSVTSHASKHTKKSTSKHSGKSSAGEASPKVSQHTTSYHYKNCNCEKDKCNCKSKTCGVRDKRTTHEATSGHEKEDCHCKKERCNCKSVTCGMRDKSAKREKCLCVVDDCNCKRITCDIRDNRMKSETKTPIVPVHQSSKKKVTSMINVVEPEPEPVVYDKPESVHSLADRSITILPPREDTPPPSPERYESILKPPSREETPPISPKRYESPIRSPVREETPPPSPKRYESPIKSPVREETPPPSPKRYESPIRSPVREETPPPSPKRYESFLKPPSREETPAPSPKRYESPIRSPAREETPPPSPKRYESPIRQPAREETPPPSPKRYESPIRSPAREETPPPSPKRYESPIRSPAREETPPPSPKRYESPIRSPAREETPPPSPKRYESPIRPLAREETPPPSPEIDEPYIPMTRIASRENTPPPTPKKYDSSGWLQLKEVERTQSKITNFEPLLRNTSSPLKEESLTMVHLHSPFSTPPRQESPIKLEPRTPPRQESPMRAIPTTPPADCGDSKLLKSPPTRSTVILAKCPQKSVQERQRARSVSISKTRVRDYIPIWYQKTGSNSSDWTDGGIFYTKQHDPSNQPGAFAPHVHVEEIVKKEKRHRGIPDYSPYSNEDFHHKRKKKNKKHRDTDSMDDMSVSTRGANSKNYAVNFYDPSNSYSWNNAMKTNPNYNKSTRVMSFQKNMHIPFSNIKDTPYSSTLAQKADSTSMFDLTSVYSSIATSTFGIQAYSTTFTYDQPCNCAIKNCDCLYACSSRKKVNQSKSREITTRDRCVNPSEITACSRGRPSSRSKKSRETLSSEYSLSSRGGGRSFVFLKRGMSEGDTLGECFCKTEDCQCIYEPCASRERGKRRVRRKKKEKKIKAMKRARAKHLDEDKCILCRVDAIERPFSWCMRTCCVTWVWNDREFKRHCGRELGPLPEYREKPASLSESWLQRTWNKRYELDEGDGDSMSVSTITTV